MDAKEVLDWARAGIDSAQDIAARQQFKLIEEGTMRLITLGGGEVPVLAIAPPIKDMEPAVQYLRDRVTALEAEVTKHAVVLRGGLWQFLVKLWKREA